MTTSDVRNPRALALSDKVVLGYLLKASDATTEEEEEVEVEVVAAEACTKCPNKHGNPKKTERMTGDQYIT
jgi:hypothetical protein